MPGPSTESLIQLLERGANAKYRDAYDRHYPVQREWLSKVMELDVPSDKAIEIFPYPLAQPHARRWPDGEAIPEGSTASRSFTVVNRRWGLRLNLSEFQVTFDQINKAMDSAAQGGVSLTLIPERVRFQIMLGTVDKDLLPAVPNAADGAALYSATDGGGSDRFATVGGNIFGGSGTGSVAAFIADFYGAVGQAKQWQDGKGQPLWGDEVFDAQIMVDVGAHNELVAKQAVAQNFVFQTAAGSSAAPSNLLKDAGQNIRIRPTQRIAAGNDDWFIWFTGVQQKAIIQTLASPMRYIFKTPQTSDWCSTYATILLQWDMLAGFGVGEAFSTIKVNN